MTKETDNLQAYTKKITFRELIEVQKQPQSWLINLSFEKVFDLKSNVDFIPIVYQERSLIKTHSLLVFDINKMQVIN